MIGYFKVSAIGTDHLDKPDGVCQDYSDVIQLPNGYTIAVIADGLGSAVKSDMGSKKAVEATLDYISKNIRSDQNDEFYLQLLEQSYHSAYNNVILCARDMRANENEFNTTLAAAIYDGKTLFYGQCGDGGIIALTNQGEYVCVTSVKKGEAFNETFPLLGGKNNWSFGKYDGDVCAITMMTDGIFDIVCHPLLANEKQPINIPFIRRFMDRNILKANNAEDFVSLQNSIERFVSGKGLPGVTDDKTIVGLINTEIMPELKEDEYYTEPDWEALKEKMNNKLRERNFQRQDTAVNPEPFLKAQPARISSHSVSQNEEPEPDTEQAGNIGGSNRTRKKIAFFHRIIAIQFIVILLLTIALCISIVHNTSESESKDRDVSSTGSAATEVISETEGIITDSHDIKG